MVLFMFSFFICSHNLNSYRESKIRIPHLVPLNKQAVAILTEFQTWAGENGLFFTGEHAPRKPISENTVNKTLRTMGYDTTKEACGHRRLSSLNLMIL
ncbi:hypothetical protein FNU29_13315 [Escherichia albertii]|nr:hypothetical protein [Escherichia albertii]